MLNFSEAIDRETANINNLRVYTKEGNVPVANSAANITVSNDGKTVTVKLPTNVEAKTAYNLVVKNVKAEEADKVVVEKTVQFTTSDVAVVESVEYTNKSDNLTSSAGVNVKKMTVSFNQNIAPSTVINSNIYLVDVATGKRVEVALGLSGSTVTVTPTNVLEPSTAKKYELTIQNLETTTGEAVEKFVEKFVVNDAKPAFGDVKTIDNKNVKGETIWGKITPGTHVAFKPADNTEVSTYYAGLKLNIPVTNRLDADSINENIRIVEVETEKVASATAVYNADAKMITLTPEANLKENTEYEIQYLGGLKTELGTYLDSAKKNEAIRKDGFTTLDITAPVVEEITSANGGMNLEVDKVQDFTVKISEDITLVKENIVIVSSEVKYDDKTTFSGDKKILKPGTDYSVTKVAGTEDTYRVRILANRLAENKTYNVGVAGKDLVNTDFLKRVTNPILVLADTDGNALTRTYNYAVTTEGVDVTAPKLENVYRDKDDKNADKIVTSGSITNVVEDDQLTFAFDEIVSIKDADKIKLQEKTGSRWTTKDLIQTKKADVNDKNGKKTLISVTFKALENKEYRLVMEAGAIQDAAVSPNETLKDITFEFIGSANKISATNIDILTGTVAGTKLTPSADLENVAADTKIYVGFEESAIFEVPASKVKVTDAAGNEVAGKFEEVDTKIEEGLLKGKQFVFTPTADLKNDTVYTVTIDGVKDSIGNTVAKKVVSFKTVAGDAKVIESSVVNDQQNVDRQKTITFKLDQAEDLTTDSKVTLTGDNVSNLKVNTTNNKDYTVNFDELDANKSYKLEIKASGKTETINFTTGVKSTDDLAPTLKTVGTKNYKDADTLVKGVAAANPMKLVFSEDIASVGTITITNLSDAKPESQTSVISKTINTTDKKELSVTFANTLKNTNYYSITIKDVKDLAGNVTDSITVKVQTE